MSDMNFIVREPLLDPHEEVLGYALAWHQNEIAPGRSSETDLELIALLANRLNDEQSSSLLGDTLLFLETSPAILATETLGTLPPKNTVLTLHLADLADADTFAAVKTLRGQGFGISLQGADLAAQDKAWMPYVSHIEVCYGADDFEAQVMSHRSHNSSSTRMVARRVFNWQEYDACASQGLDAFVGNLHLTPREGNRPKGMNPGQTMILQLMEMVRKNADVRQLEGVLKRDAALSYKLLRYINSAGFGLGCEIQSLRHAVTMLGYSPLYRWLALLLATAGATSPALMQTAVIRGRFAELLGQAFLPKNEAENLFVAGMFSLLDRLLGLPMEQVLDTIQLSDAVSQALISREGIYGPFLALAEACEVNPAQVEELADSLFISAKQVNQAHLSALVWAQSIKF